jgi:hypothetical protein
MKRKHLIETHVCPRERLIIISYTTGLSFALERIGPLAAIVITVFYLLILYLLALPNIPENPFASIYSEFLIETTCQHLLLRHSYLSKVLRYTPYTCGPSGFWGDYKEYDSLYILERNDKKDLSFLHVWPFS